MVLALLFLRQGKHLFRIQRLWRPGYRRFLSEEQRIAPDFKLRKEVAKQQAVSRMGGSQPLRNKARPLSEVRAPAKRIKTESLVPRKSPFPQPISNASIFDDYQKRVENYRTTRKGTEGEDQEEHGGESEEKVDFNVRVVQPNWKQRRKELLFEAYRVLGMVGILFGVYYVYNVVRRVTGGGSPSVAGITVEANVVMASDVTFDDVKGVDEAKEELEEIVSYLKDPEHLHRLGGKMPKGLLLVGPPGTGKTLLAKAIAGEAGVPFFYASGSEFDQMFVGVGAMRMRHLFKKAKENRPCIVFIDEIDAVGGSRRTFTGRVNHDSLNQFLVEMDGFADSTGVVVIGATNFPDALDSALTRPGRFDRQVQVPLPTVEGRREILDLYLSKVVVVDEVDVGVLAKNTVGFSGADLSNLINTAVLWAVRQDREGLTQEDVEYALDRLTMGLERRSMQQKAKVLRRTAYHEGGHALVACLTESVTVHKATIVPRGGTLGHVRIVPEEDGGVSRKESLESMDVALAGRAAEEVVGGEENVTAGAASDLKKATSLAHTMVTQWGMSPSLGKVVVDTSPQAERTVSQETLVAVDREVKSMVEESYERVKKLIAKHRQRLDVLVEALLEKETLSGEEVRKIVLE